MTVCRIERKERAHLHTVRSHSKSPDRKSVSSLSPLSYRSLSYHVTATRLPLQDHVTINDG